MKSPTLSRAEQNERTRQDLLVAARTVFEEAGYHGATLDRIAEAAGYTKGAVYSRFGSKADPFLALIEARQAERLAALEATAALDARERIIRWVRTFAERLDSELPWRLVLAEFRAAAHRDPELNARYAHLHRRVRMAVADLFERLYADLGVAPPASVAVLADSMFAIETGIALERAADPATLPVEDQVVLALRITLGDEADSEVKP